MLVLLLLHPPLAQVQLCDGIAVLGSQRHRVRQRFKLPMGVLEGDLFDHVGELEIFPTLFSEYLMPRRRPP